MSVICRVLCEDYGARLSGGPDLFLWNAKEHTCKFVEVKGPGDTLQENQKVRVICLPAPYRITVAPQRFGLMCYSGLLFLWRFVM